MDIFALAQANAMFSTDAASPLRHILIEERLNQTHNLGIVLAACAVEMKVSWVTDTQVHNADHTM